MNLPTLEPPALPTELVLVDYQTWQQWFPPGPDPLPDENVSRQVSEIALGILPHRMLQE